MRSTAIMTILLSASLLAVSLRAQDKPIEHEVAGLRPGVDSIDRAYHRFGKNHQFGALSRPGSAVWEDVCNRQLLTVAFDTDGVIREVTIEYPAWETMADCTQKSYSRNVRSRMGSTKHGLIFRDRCDRVEEIYGPPQSQSSVNGREELIYQYDKAVKRSSLTFKVTCDPARNEVEDIRLTASPRQ